jgi:hypothetical protein
MAKVPAVHREARFFRIRVTVSTEKSDLLDTHTSRSKCERLHCPKYYRKSDFSRLVTLQLRVFA